MIGIRGSAFPRSGTIAPRELLRWVLAGMALLGASASLRAQENAACLKCHGADRAGLDSESRSVAKVVDVGALGKSVHSRVDCVGCHADLSGVDKFPHSAKLLPVDCGQCHEDAAGVYVKHGRMQKGKDADFPACWKCHGSHDILSASDRASGVHPLNLATACKTCHTNTDVIKNHEVLRNEPIKLYAGSVHGQAVSRGLEMAATCADCHSANGAEGKRTAHRILAGSDPESPIFHFNIPNMCGKCHKGVAEDYWEGIHGQLVKRGEVDAPVCTRCHGEHGILSPTDVRSPVSAARLAEQTCAPCHESAVLNERYGIPSGRLKSYVDSYHGLKRKAGNVHVANCSSCHGGHRILPHTDPRSSIHSFNLQQTCGKCHPGISEVLANASIHETATGLRTGWPRFIAVVYMWLIGGTIGLMVLHNLGHWVRQARLMGKADYVIRMTAGETAQHWILMGSFIVLVISGFSLRFSEAWWVDLLFGWGGGEGFIIRGTVHRISAVVFLVWGVWHAVYLMTRRGRGWLRDMIAGAADVRHVRENALYFLGRRERGPKFGRFTYMEKCEYWALMWGAVIMTVTGALLWFDDYFTARWHLPKGVLDVALVIHYYEAWLATLAILVWHVYGTVFNPEVYPMNPAWLSGRMPKTMYTHEHEAAPNLRAHEHAVRPEEELEADVDTTAGGGNGGHGASLVPGRTGGASESDPPK